MAGAMVSASAGVMNSVIGKLTSLLSDEYNHLKRVKKGIRWLRDELSSMNAVLQRLADMEDEDIDPQTKEWRNKVRELSYDIEDCIDRFVQNHSRGDAKANFVSKGVRMMKKLWENHQIGDEINELKVRVLEEKERHDRYNIEDHLNPLSQPVRLDPRAPALYEQAKNLVGIDKPREDIIGWIKSEEKQLKVVSIFGTGGLGKTTLALEVYHKIEESFDCRAMVSVSRTPDIKKLLREILFQINKSEYERSKEWEIDQLIPTLRENLNEKRYFVIIDDIWSTDAWEHLKSALPANDKRSRIITTTRIRDVAKSCCRDFDGNMYKAMPLSEDNSRSLFFRRLFSGDCPKYLMEAASVILRKCGGLPLAIISLAGLLSNKNPTVEEWNKIMNSISSAVDKDSSVDKMKRILFLSYFDLPHHLKTCMLYLSVFPEDSDIDARRLIWLWVAEGLIPGPNRECMELRGENYLHELINRSMIQPTKIGSDGTTVKLCGVHDVILDFIVSQAVEENFVTILNSSDSCGDSSITFRRLSLQSYFSEGSEMPKALKDLSHLRSFHMCKSGSIPAVPSNFLKCQVLRVLNIEVDGNLEDCYIKHIGNFCELKYLRIEARSIKLPEQIGKLRHLETLDLAKTYIKNFPASIVQLQKLVRLFVHFPVPFPDGIENLQTLEVLSGISLEGASVESINGLGELRKLRELKFSCNYDGDTSKKGHKTACLSTLSRLLKCRLQSLDVYWGLESTDVIDAWMISCGSLSPLRRLRLHNEIPTLPSQFMSLVNLTRLRINVGGVGGLEILASLPMLLSLTLQLRINSHVRNLRQVISDQGFQHLRKFYFLGWDSVVGLMFEPGAMPKLQMLKLFFFPCYQIEHGGTVVGLHHLPVLKSIALTLDCGRAYADEVESLEDEIKAAAVVHPNHPTLNIERLFEWDIRMPGQQRDYEGCSFFGQKKRRTWY